MTTDDELRKRFETVFAPGNLWTITGPARGEKRGVAKTTWAVQCLQSAIEHGYIAMGNILFKKPIRDEHGNILDWQEAVPEGYLKVRSFAEAVYALVERGILRRRQKVLLVIDESMMVAGMRGGAGSGLQTREGASIAAFNTQIRKLGISILLIGLGDRFAASMYRADEAGSMVTGSMRRVKLPGYEIREIVEVQTPVGAIYVNTLPLRGLARPQEWLTVEGADDGPVFESFSPATFEMGAFRKSGRPFDMNAFLAAISNTISEHAADAVERFLENEGIESAPEPSPTPEPVVPFAAPEKHVEFVKPNTTIQIHQLLHNHPDWSDAEIGRNIVPPVTKQAVQQQRVKLHKEGKL